MPGSTAQDRWIPVRRNRRRLPGGGGMGARPRCCRQCPPTTERLGRRGAGTGFSLSVDVCTWRGRRADACSRRHHSASGLRHGHGCDVMRSWAAGSLWPCSDQRLGVPSRHTDVRILRGVVVLRGVRLGEALPGLLPRICVAEERGELPGTCTPRP